MAYPKLEWQLRKKQSSCTIETANDYHNMDTSYDLIIAISTRYILCAIAPFITMD